MTEFANDNSKNINISYIFFELNCNFYPRIYHKKDINPQSKLISVDKLVAELRDVINIFKKTFNMPKKFSICKAYKLCFRQKYLV